MRIFRVGFRRFRSFADMTVRPNGHVVLLGPPRSGRTTVIEGLNRVLDPETPRRRAGDEFDFLGGDKSSPAEIEIVIGDLGNDLEQDFLDELEVWSSTEQEILTEAASPSDIDKETCSWALRLTYRLEWIEAEERANEFVYYPKTSEPGSGVFSYARPSDIERLAFRRVRAFSGRLFDLSERGGFRQLIDSDTATDFADAVASYLGAVEASAADFIRSDQVKGAAKRVLEPIAGPLGIEAGDVENLLRFIPEGGATSGLLRSVTPTIDLNDGAGLLPASRHGSSLASILRLAEAYCSLEAAIIAVDDLGDGLDDAASLHMAALAQKLAGQVWITTRNTSIAEVFDPDEVFRIGRKDGERVIHQGRRAANRGERVSAKHWMRSILPALPFSSVAILEGPDDLSALHTVSLRLFREKGVALPGTIGLRFISAAAAGSGGSSSVRKVAQLANEIGLWAIAVIDWDKDDAEGTLEKAKRAADTVIRLPDRHAIERAMVINVEPGTLAGGVAELAAATGFQISKDPLSMGEDELRETAIGLLKSSGGLHSAFLELLPIEQLSPVLVRLYEAIMAAAKNRTAGHIQL